MSGPEDDIAQAEKRQIIREQATTFHQHAVSQADELSQGRFAALGTPHVTGATPAVRYPQLPSSSPWSGAQPEPGPEPPTGYRIDEMPPLESSTMLPVVEVGAPVSAAPSSGVQAQSPADDVETGTGAPPFSEQTKNE